MPAERGPTLLVDTVTLSNFALARRLDILTRRYPSRIAVSTTVLDEILHGVQEGYALHGVLDLAQDGAIEVFMLSPAQRRSCLELQVRLGAGEASLIAAAPSRQATVATDDRVARAACRLRGIPVTGTIGILRAAVRERQLEVGEADTILERMVAAGFYSPVTSVSATL